MAAMLLRWGKGKCAEQCPHRRVRRRFISFLDAVFF